MNRISPLWWALPVLLLLGIAAYLMPRRRFITFPISPSTRCFGNLGYRSLGGEAVPKTDINSEERDIQAAISLWQSNTVNHLMGIAHSNTGNTRAHLVEVPVVWLLTDIVYRSTNQVLSALEITDKFEALFGTNMVEIAPDLERLLANYNQSSWDKRPLTMAEHYGLMTSGHEALGQGMKSLANRLVLNTGMSEDQVVTSELFLQCRWYVAMNQDIAGIELFGSPVLPDAKDIDPNIFRNEAMKEYQVHSNALAQCFSYIFKQLGYSEPEALRGKIADITIPNLSISALEIPAIIYP